MNRKQIALFIMLVLVATLFVTPYKKKVVADSPYQYEVISETDKTARLTHISASGEKVVIPQSIDGYKIIEVGRFQQIAYHEIEIGSPNGVSMNIGDVLSEHEKNSVKTIVFPKTVLKIGNNAFRNCKNLENVTFSSSLRHMGSSAFENCVQIRKVSLDKNLSTIGACAFSKCNSLERVTIKSNKVKIGQSAFGESNIIYSQEKYKLKEINLPRNFYGRLFEDCFNSYIGKKFTWIDFRGENSSTSKGIFRGAKNLNTIVIPEGTKNVFIGQDSIFTQKKVKQIVVPKSAKTFVMEQQSRLVDRIVFLGKNTEVISDDIMGGGTGEYICAKEIIAPVGSKAIKYAKKCVYPDISEERDHYSIHAYTEEFVEMEDVYCNSVSLPSKPKVTLSGKKVKWTKTKKAEKYEIYYSAKKKGTYKLVATTKKTSYSLKKKGYVKVRAVRKTYDTDWRGDFSKVVKMK